MIFFDGDCVRSHRFSFSSAQQKFFYDAIDRFSRMEMPVGCEMEPVGVPRRPDGRAKLGRQVSRQTGKEEDEIVRQLRQRVAILLVRDNVNMFDSRTPSYPQAVIDADVDINV